MGFAPGPAPPFSTAFFVSPLLGSVVAVAVAVDDIMFVGVGICRSLQLLFFVVVVDLKQIQTKSNNDQNAKAKQLQHSFLISLFLSLPFVPISPAGENSRDFPQIKEICLAHSNAYVR